MTFFDSQVFETFVGQLMLQLTLITLLPKVINIALSRLAQPLVISEIISGIVLGPTVLGNIPGFSKKVFPTASLPALQAIAQLALILFLLLVGLNLDPKKIIKNITRSLSCSVAGIIIPTLVGIPLSYLIKGHPEYTNSTQVVIAMYIGLIFAISALALLARIMGEIGLINTDLGVFVMCTTAFDTFICWVYLAVIVSIHRGGSSILDRYSGLWVVLTTIAHALVLWFVVRKILIRISDRVNRKGQLEPLMFWAIILITLAVAYVTEMIGISGLFGSFEIGLLIPRKGPTVKFVKEKIEEVVVIVLLPVYMAYSGLRTDLKLIKGGGSWGIAFLFVPAAFFSKALSVMTVAKIFKSETFDAIGFGVLMSCKGLVALVMLNTGLDNDLITQEFFAMFVLYSVCATLITTPLLKLVFHLKRKRERKKVKPSHTTYNVFILPRTPYMGAPITTLAYCLSDRTGHKRKQTSRVTAARLIDPDQHYGNLGMQKQSHLAEDEILSHCKQRADFFHMHVTLRFLVGREPMDELLQYCHDHLEDIILIGIDRTSQGEDLIRALLRKGKAHIGAFYCKQDFGSLQKIILPYSGSVHNRLAVKWTKKILAKFEAEVTVLLLTEEPEEGLPFLSPTNPHSFKRFNLINAVGSDAMHTIITETTKNPHSLLIMSQIDVNVETDIQSDESLRVIDQLTEAGCPLIFCSSGKGKVTSSDASSSESSSFFDDTGNTELNEIAPSETTATSVHSADKSK